MKILKVLLTENAAQTYRDLSDIQTTVLYRVASGKTTAETASQREMGVMDELATLGLLQDLSYEPTELGLRISNITQKLGSHDARNMQRRIQKPGGVKAFGTGRSYTNVGDASDPIGAGDGLASEMDSDSLRGGSIHR